MTVAARQHLFIPARDVLPGDMIVLAKTSGGITLTAQRTLVLDAREQSVHVDAHTIAQRTWLQLDPTGVPIVSSHRRVLGTFLDPDDQLEVWR